MGGTGTFRRWASLNAQAHHCQSGWTLDTSPTNDERQTKTGPFRMPRDARPVHKLVALAAAVPLLQRAPLTNVDNEIEKENH